MANLDELEFMSRTGDEEFMLDDEAEDTIDDGTDSQIMPPPTGIPKKRKQCGACDDKCTASQWASTRERKNLTCQNSTLPPLPHLHLPFLPRALPS